MTKDYNLIKWDEIFYYDESSPTCIRWKISPHARINPGEVAGSLQFDKKGRPSRILLNYGRKCFVISRIVWILNFGNIPIGKVINHIDCNPHNNRIKNLELCSQRENMNRSKVTKGQLQDNNQTGHNGVFEEVKYSNNKEYHYFVAIYLNVDGKACRKRFSIGRYGVIPALHMALKFRIENHYSYQEKE